MMTTRNNGLVIQNLTFTKRKVTFLKNIQLQAQPGELVLLCGASGSGKSTLAAILSGYYPLHGGKLQVEELTWEGQNLADFSDKERLRQIAVSFQNARLSFCMNTLREELIFILENLLVPPSQMPQIIARYVEIHQLESYLDQPFSSLSGGELQRAAFCCLDIMDPGCYVLDEPFSNLDDDAIEFLQGLIQQRLAEGKTFLVIDHRLDLWQDAQRFYILEDANLTSVTDFYSSTTQDLFFKAGLLGKSEPAPKIKSTTSPLLEAKDLTIRFHSSQGEKIILQDASFSFPKEKLIALCGQSGCGKSTLFKAILGQCSYQGTITYEDKDLKKVKPSTFFGEIGLVFQDPSLQFVTNRVLDEVLVGTSKEEEKRGRDLLEHYKLLNDKSRSPWTLSQGEQRRLAVICLLLHGQKLLLVDEPTYGQDWQNAAKLMAQLQDLCRHGVTCCFTSHDRRLVEAYADIELRMENKKVSVVS